MIESLLLQTIELILKFSIRKVERNQKVIRILKALGLDKLRDDFDSIYARTLVEYGVDNKSKKLLQIFSEKKVITAFKEQLYNKDNEGEFKKKVEAFLQLGMAYKTIKNLDEEIDQFKSKFNEFTNTTRTPKELEMFNKIMALELSNIERTFDYQVEQYINRIGDELHKELTEKTKYIDLIGEVRKERKDLIEHSESEIKKSKTERNVRVYKSYNVEEKYEEIKYDPIDTFITPWLNNDNKNFLLLLGEYGTGKTTLCKHIVCELIKNLLESRETNNIYDEKFRIPILF
ncbi:MAG TPA: hypothetical protein ENI76_07570, partial [Ignavibacteria bacterium]|nr:hypothetical protein [Ignavibacteria bacterium]